MSFELKRYAKTRITRRGLKSKISMRRVMGDVSGVSSKAIDITLFELRDALSYATGLQARHSALGHLLKRFGFTHKKSLEATLHAAMPE